MLPWQFNRCPCVDQFSNSFKTSQQYSDAMHRCHFLSPSVFLVLLGFAGPRIKFHLYPPAGPTCLSHAPLLFPASEPPPPQQHAPALHAAVHTHRRRCSRPSHTYRYRHRASPWCRSLTPREPTSSRPPRAQETELSPLSHH